MVGKHKATLSEKIERAARGLVYISETDSEVEAIAAGKCDATTAADIRMMFGISPATEMAAEDADAFFERLSRKRDWHSERDARNAEGFAKLHKLLKKELHDLRVFRVGHIRLMIYVVGLDKKRRMRGVKMQAVET